MKYMLMAISLGTAFNSLSCFFNCFKQGQSDAQPPSWKRKPSTYESTCSLSLSEISETSTTIALPQSALPQTNSLVLPYTKVVLSEKARIALKQIRHSFAQKADVMVQLKIRGHFFQSAATIEGLTVDGVEQIIAADASALPSTKTVETL